MKTFGRVYLAGTAEYAHFENDTDRVIDFVVDERARGSFNSDSFGGRLETGWRAYWGRYYVTPFVAVDAYRLEQRRLHREQPQPERRSGHSRPDFRLRYRERP